MRVGKNIFGFTLLEFLIASGLTVAVVAAAIVGINAILDYKRSETVKPKLMLEASNVLEMIERDFDNKCISLGNLLCREQSYPFQYFPAQGTAYPSLMFFIHSADGPQLLCYTLGPLPSTIGGDATTTSPCGLFKSVRDAETSATIWQIFESVTDLRTSFNNVTNLASLVSESIVLFEVRPMKIQSDGTSLDYFNAAVQTIKINCGQFMLDQSNGELKDLALLEITIGVLAKSQHKEYFLLAVEERKTFLDQNGVRLSRLLPWRI